MWFEGWGGGYVNLLRQYIALIALVALFGLSAHPLAHATDGRVQQAAPTLLLAPAEGNPGSTVTASGEGYCGSVILRWDGKTELASGQSHERGAISIIFTVPADAPLGPHAVTSNSQCGGAQASFTVVKAPPATTSQPAPTSQPTPTHGRPPKPPPTPPATPGAAPPGASPPLTTAPPPEPPPRTTTALPSPTRPGAAPPGLSPLAPGGTQDSTLEQYEEIVKRELQPGVILYNPPGNMRVGVTDRVEVRISRAMSDQLAQDLQGEGNPRVEQLLVGTTLRAKLDGNAFNIVLIGSDVQELPATGYREWRWDVTPIASGNAPLFFTVSVLYEKYSNPIEERVFERRIDVSINPVYSVLEWLPNNWEKSVAALVGIIGIIEGYRRLRLKRTDGRPDDVTPASSED